MVDDPTRGAQEAEDRWTPSPVKAGAVRFVAFAIPIIAGWVAIQVLDQFFWRPNGWQGLLTWLLQAVAVGWIASRMAHRAARRLMPLAYLFEQTLVFPDAAPSRFSTTLRSTSLGPLHRQIEDVCRADVHGNNQEAALHALSLIAALSRHDRFTRGHTERVKAYADLIAEEMGLPQEDRDRLAWGVLLHDIGKLAVPADVLNKKSALTNDEWVTLRKHPEAGAAMVEPLRPWLGDWVDATVDHHERFEGGGYPSGSAGTDISLAGRITAVADAFDVINSSRSYKSAQSPEAARQELVRCAGTQFDPAVVRAMVRVSIQSKQRNLGALAWLAEAPAVARSLLAAASTPAVAATTAAATITAGVAPLTPAFDVVPEEIAFAAAPSEERVAELFDLSVGSTLVALPSSPALDEQNPDPVQATTTTSGRTSTTAPLPLTPSEAPTTTVRSSQGQLGEAAAVETAVPTTASLSSTTLTTAPSTSTALLTTTSTTTPSTTSTTSPALDTSTTAPPPTFERQNAYLEAAAEGDTTSSALLPISTTRPTGPIDNVDTDRDDLPGLLIKRDGAGLGGTDPEKIQVWSIDINTAIRIDNDAEFQLLIAAADFERQTQIGYAVELLHCSATCTQLASGSATATSRRAFASVDIDLGQITADLAVGDQFVIRVAVPDAVSSTDVMVAFGSSSAASGLQLS